MTKKKPTVIVNMQPAKRKRAKKAKARAAKAEITHIGKALRALGGLGGSVAGGLLGQSAAGHSIGTSLGAAISRWLGAGDYRVAGNTIVQRSTQGIPSMHLNSQSIVVRHKEYLGEVKGAQAFTVRNAYPLNPGSTNTFPWLATIAQKFQEYSFKGVVFHYIPTSGSAVSSTNAALGSVMLQTSYRASDTNPSSKVEMLNEYCASEAAPNETFAHPIECSPAENPFKTQYVRGAVVPTGDPIMLYDLGKTFLAVSGQQADNIVLGDLWVSYEVELRKPVLAGDTTDAIPGEQAKFTTVTSANWFGGTPLVTTSLLSFATKTMTFPAGSSGNWLVEVSVVSTASDLTISNSSPTLTNCSLTAVDYGVASSGSLYAPNSSPTSLYMDRLMVFIPDPTVIATVRFNTTFTGGTSLVCYATVTKTDF